MKTITTDKMTIGLVEVPTMGFGYFVNNYTFKQELIYFLDSEDLDIEENDDYQIVKDLPFVKTDYTFLSTTKDLTEEVAKKFLSYTIESEKMYYRDYKHPAFLERQLYWFDNWQESFSSLLKVNGLNPSKNYAILEIKK